MRHIHTFTVMVAVLVLACFSVSGAWAQNPSTNESQRNPGMMCQDRFNSLDKNKDGNVDKDEFMSIQHPGGNAENIFISRDSNGDGILTRDEFCAGKGFHGGRSQ
jgi:hypothetical protein